MKMENSIKTQVKEIFKANSFETALELIGSLRDEYIKKEGKRSWNALKAYYKKANIQPETDKVAEAQTSYPETPVKEEVKVTEKSTGKKISETPLMKQYAEIKKKYPDAVLLFRVGDFYEMFGEDAVEASKILGITLTRRANGKAASIELAGFPFHALDTYLPQLVRAGKRVAICEQLEDPKKMKVTEKVIPNEKPKGLFEDEQKVLEIAETKQEMTKDQKEEDAVEYMLYRNEGGMVEWFGHFVNYNNLKVGDNDTMIRMNNRGVSRGTVVATNRLTLAQVAIFHRCYGIIIKMKRTYKEQLDLAAQCLNKIPQATESGNIPENDIKLTDMVLNFKGNN